MRDQRSVIADRTAGRGFAHLTFCKNGARTEASVPASLFLHHFRKNHSMQEVCSIPIIPKDSVLTYQTSTQEYVVFNVSGWIISMGRRNSLAYEIALSVSSPRADAGS